MKFSCLYGRSWTSLQCGEKAQALLKQTWLEIISKMTFEEITLAMMYLQSDWNKAHTDFPPNPLQFRGFPLRMKERSIPAMDECYNAAIKCDWDFHPIVYPTAHACDLYWLKKQASAYEGRKRFSGHYESQKEKYLRGERLLQPEIRAERLITGDNKAKTEKESDEKDVNSMQMEVNKKVTQLQHSPVYQRFSAADGLRAKLAIVRSKGSTLSQKNMNWLDRADDGDVSAKQCA